MLRIFKVKRAVKNINPLTDDPKNTYYEEVNMGGLMPNERALKVCYQNGDIWKLKDFTTKTGQVEIQKVLNSTLYEFNGFFIIKDKNDTASREYYCFITVDKKNEVSEDKHWLIWLTVYYDLNGSTGFKILLRWDLENFIFTIVKDPIQINLLEGDDFNAEKNHYSLPTVAVVKKWYYHKEWLEINTPNPTNNGQSMLYSIPVKCPMNVIEMKMPSEDTIRTLIRNRLTKTDKEYDLLSMDFGRQPGYNGYNSIIISNGNPINNYEGMKRDNGYAWLSWLGGQNKGNPYDKVLFKILDKDGKAIKHPLHRNVLNIGGIKMTLYDGKVYAYAMNNTDEAYLNELSWHVFMYNNRYFSSVNKTIDNNKYLNYIPFQLIYPITVKNDNKFEKIPFNPSLYWTVDFQLKTTDDNINAVDYDFFYQTQIGEFDDKPLDERCYMPLWDKIQFQIIPDVSNLIVKERNEVIKNYVIYENYDYYWGHNSHLQLKYLVGYWKARS